MKVWVYLRLLVNFISGLVASGWDTARIILARPGIHQAGLVQMNYQGLSAEQAGLVGALITLAPGSTTIDIDTEQQVFILHLLDLQRSEDALRGIQRDFIRPLQTLNGGGL